MYKKLHIHIHPFKKKNPTLHIPGICVKQMQFHHDGDGYSSCCEHPQAGVLLGLTWILQTRCWKWTQMLALAFNSHNPLFHRPGTRSGDDWIFVTAWPADGFRCVFHFKFSHAKPWGGRSNGNKARGDFHRCPVHVKSIWFTHANKTKSERR